MEEPSFGHTHAAQNLPLGYGTAAPLYLNTGTWACLTPPAVDTVRTIRPTFVHLTTARDGDPRTARLLAWNASSESAETLRFQAERRYTEPKPCRCPSMASDTRPGR